MACKNPRKWGWAKFFFVLVIMPASVLAEEVSVDECRTLTAGRAPTMKAELVRVVDGDTIRVRIAGRQLNVRLLSIDTPETNFRGKSQGVWAERATRHLERQVDEGEIITIEFEGERCDKFGRILGHLHAGGVHLNRLMLEEGLAVNYCIYPNVRYCKDFSEIVTRNIRVKKGMFGDSSVEVPYEWRKRVSNQSWDKYTGNLKTKDVYEARQLRRVPLELRVFFFRERDILPPYELVN